MKRALLTCSLFLCLLPALTTPAFALQYSFTGIGDDGVPADIAVGEAQFSMDVVDVTVSSSNPQALFAFNNDGAMASSICGIYFDGDRFGNPAPSLTLINPYLTTSADLEFSVGAIPVNLPGADTDPYNFVAEYSFEATSPVATHGIIPGESLGILFALSGTTFAQLTDALEDGNLRVGLHAQSFLPDGGSESFLNNETPVPEPTTMLLLATGLAGLTGSLKKKLHRGQTA